MKILIGIFILIFGVVSLGFAQREENKNPTIKDLKSSKPQLLDSLQELDFDSWNGLLIDSAWIFRPEGLFQEKYLKIKPTLFEIPSPGIYALPDPQSRMPIKTFDDSVNYTILRKEYR